MRKPRPRLTIRWMLALVAIVALTFEVEIWRRRLPICRRNADRSRLAEKAHLRMAESHERIARLYREHAAMPGESARYNLQQAARFARFEAVERVEAAKAADRRQLFQNAARFPWLAIPAAEGDTLGAGVIERAENAGK